MQIEAINKSNDVSAFLKVLESLPAHPHSDLRNLFEANQQLFIARAPGRLDVMGGIADYSGSLVLQRPIAEATFAALQTKREPSIKVVSLSDNANEQAKSYELPLSDLFTNGQPISYESAREFFRRDETYHWAAYVIGVFLVLAHERGAKFEEGANVLISSRVPEGKGVSSSAALEVAVMQAVTAAYGIQLEPRETAILCQKVENLVVGAPCGIMDQMTSVCGQSDSLLALLCQPAELQDAVRLAPEIAIWGIDSGERHAVSGSDYGSVRTGAFMGYRIIAESAGLKAGQALMGNPVQIDDPRWQGYLANLSVSEFEREYASLLPEEMRGDEFLRRFGGTTDFVTRVDSQRTYKVRQPAAHPVYENHRVRTFRQLLNAPFSLEQMQLLGELMYQSHQSYSACGLGSKGTDLIVNLVRKAGPQSGLFGARITGGGSGGTVAIIGTRDAQNAVREIARSYEEALGHHPYIFSGSSQGAAKFGTFVFQISG